MSIKFERKIQQLGSKSMCVTIPQEIVKALKIKKHELVEMHLEEDSKIVIEKKR